MVIVNMDFQAGIIQARNNGTQTGGLTVIHQNQSPDFGERNVLEPLKVIKKIH